MRFFSIVLISVALLVGAEPLLADFEYPDTREGDVVENLHGVEVADPYRWLEDVNSAETEAWVTAQNKVTFGHLEKIEFREKLREKIAEKWNYTKYHQAFRKGNRLFYQRHDGLQNQWVQWVQDGIDGEPRPLIDPNVIDAEGTTSLGYFGVTADGGRIAYGLSEAGSDWQTIHVKDVATGEKLTDVVRWVKFSAATWTADGGGFFYGRFDAPVEGETHEAENRFQKLYYHKLGTSQEEDILVHEDHADGEVGFDPLVTDDGRYLIITVWKGSAEEYGLSYVDLQSKPWEVVPIVEEFESYYLFVGNRGSELYFITDRQAPNKRVIAIDLDDSDEDSWREIVPESRSVINAAALSGGNLVVQSMVDVKDRLDVYGPQGEHIREIELPTMGAVESLDGSDGSSEIFYSFTSFTYPGTIFRTDAATGESTPFLSPDVDMNADDFVTEQVFYESKDGTKVPMYLVYKKDSEKDGSNPTYLHGYGGFNSSSMPYYSTSRMVWVELGGIYALANIRGGGEYGRKWHEGGKLHNKQNVFDDFIAAGEYLIDEGYTSRSKLSIGGGSNGGLLTAACMLQRPDLFAAVVTRVGVLDMLRFHKFTIGWAWTSDYGSAENRDEFKTLYSYSPLHNIHHGTHYPPMIITTSDHDDRVVPSHSYKFAAAIQKAQGAPENPLLLRVATDAGHSAGMRSDKRIEEAADVWAFVLDAMGYGKWPGEE